MFNKQLHENVYSMWISIKKNISFFYLLIMLFKSIIIEIYLLAKKLLNIKNNWTKRYNNKTTYNYLFVIFFLYFFLLNENLAYKTKHYNFN